MRVPESLPAYLDLSTVHGGVSTDFPGTSRSSPHSGRVDMDVNGGGPTIHLETVNGGVSASRGSGHADAHDNDYDGRSWWPDEGAALSCPSTLLTRPAGS